MQLQHGKLKNLSQKLGNEPIDAFICSASYEDRCKSVATHLDLSRVGQAIIMKNAAFKDLILANDRELTKVFRDGDVKIKEFMVDANDPVQSADNTAKVVNGLLTAKPKRILIDITTLTREALLILVKYLKLVVEAGVLIEFAYAHAKEYSIGDSRENKWLSKGIREVRSVMGFPGDLLPSRRNHLIILVGFEDERALSLVRECEPSLISLGLGDESEKGTVPHQATNVQRMKRLKSMLDRVQEFTFHAYDAEKTKGALRALIGKAQEYNTIIAPMNTKISTLGAALVAFEDPSVQLCYAQANIYNYTRYSSPDDDYYLFTLLGFPQ